MASVKSLYEELRNKNLQDNKEILEKLMADLQDMQGFTKKVKAKAKVPRKSRRSEEVGPIRRNPTRQARQSLEGSSFLRRRRGSTSSSISSVSTSSSCTTSPSTSPNKLTVRFGFFNKSAPRREDDSCSESENEDDDFELPTRMKNTKRHKVDTRSADEITEDDLTLVATFVSEKKYDSFFGTSCHQCRQKTNDMKTICRSGHCLGARGQFCGPCLRNRYGEDAKEALKDDDWMCPPCRGICNCSFCRKKQGKSCTGILIHLAKQRGFTSVNDYLQSLKK